MGVNSQKSEYNSDGPWYNYVSTPPPHYHLEIPQAELTCEEECNVLSLDAASFLLVSHIKCITLSLNVTNERT